MSLMQHKFLYDKAVYKIVMLRLSCVTVMVWHLH